MSNYFSTSDIALAAVLSLYFPVDSLDKRNPSRVEFLFERRSELDALIQRYWSRALEVEPQAFFSSLKNLKNRIYS